MIDPKQVSLRQALYSAWGVYHQALVQYWDAIARDRTVVDPGLVLAIRSAAATLDSALVAMLTYLHQQGPLGRNNEETAHLERVRELLQQELALLPKVE
jgi:hypothetical protein